MTTSKRHIIHKTRRLILTAILALIVTLGLLLTGSALGYILTLTNPAAGKKSSRQMSY